MQFMYSGELCDDKLSLPKDKIASSESGLTAKPENFVPHELYRLMVLSEQRHVPSCIESYAGLLGKMTFTFEEACAYLEIIPDSLFGEKSTQPFRHALEKALVSRFPSFDGLISVQPNKDQMQWNKLVLPQEVVSLSLKAMELLLKSKKVKVKSENTVFRVMEMWLKAQKIEDDLYRIADQLLKLLRVEAISTDFISWHARGEDCFLVEALGGSDLMYCLAPSYLLYGSSRRESGSKEVKRRPGSRWGRLYDSEHAEFVWEIKLSEVKELYDKDRGMPLPFRRRHRWLPGQPNIVQRNHRRGR